MNADERIRSPMLPLRSTEHARSDGATVTAVVPAFAIFALPKPFDDPHIACIQRNAIASWKALGEDVAVIIIGNETGIAETAEEFSAIHVGPVQRNEQGTPLVNDAFKIASEATEAKVLVFCNADVILLHDFKHALAEIVRGDCADEFLAIGRRTNLDLQHCVDFSDRFAIEKLLEQTASQGEMAAVVCKEYFAFPRGQFDCLPPFAVGRGNWDNWMVAHSKRNGVPVIDLTNRVTAIHQNHDYRHVDVGTGGSAKLKRRRKQCYLSGVEACENQRLASGKNVITGSTASHRLTEDGVVKNRLVWLNLDFWRDLPRFVRLVGQLFLD